jgi:hypothetical protein
VDGRVLVDENPIVHKVTQFAEVKENAQLRTERGRAEVLLTPGAFLRVGEDTRIAMLSNRLTDVRLRLLAGSAVVEADDLVKDGAITVVAGTYEVRLERTGLYRFDVLEGEAPRLRVFSGEALVGATRVRARREIDLDGDLTIRKFDPEDTDPLDRWSRRRANYLAMASISAGRLELDNYSRFRRSGWAWNPYYGMYTFLPYQGVVRSPYGFGFFSPRAVYSLYNPPVYRPSPSAFAAPSYNPGYGYSTVSSTPSGNSGVMASSPGSPVNQGGGATVSRGGDTGGGGARR